MRLETRPTTPPFTFQNLGTFGYVPRKFLILDVLQVLS